MSAEEPLAENPPTDAGRRRPAHGVVVVVSPSLDDPVARATSELIGGPAGRRLAPSRGFWRAVPVLVLLAVAMLGLGVVQKEHCRAHGWSSPDMFWHACYTDIPVLYGSSALGGADRPSLTDAIGSGVAGSKQPSLGQPPLTGAAIWAASWLVDSSDATAAPRRFFDLSAALLTAVLALGVAMVALGAGRRPWDAAHVALAPILLTAGLISYDLLAMTLATAAIFFWSRQRLVLGGVMLGLAVGARPVTAVLMIAVLALALRAGRVSAAAKFCGVGLVCWLGLRLVLLPGLSAGLTQAWSNWRESSPGYGSIWLVPSLLGQSRPRVAVVWYAAGAMSPAVSTVAALLALCAVAAGTLLLTLTARQRPTLGQLCLVVMAGGLLSIKSLPIQASVLLLPFIAWAGLRWRDHLIWATTEITYFVGVWLYIAAGSDANKGLPAGMYLILMVSRLAGIGWLLVQAVRAARGPAAPDAVSDDPSDDVLPDDAEPAGQPPPEDPLAGPLDGRPDAVVVRLG